jgi:hypothetical protein
MKWSRYTEEQIAYALRQADDGTPAMESGRKIGISECAAKHGRPSRLKLLPNGVH